MKKGHIYIGDVKMGNRILVVDDEKLIVKGIKFSLEQDGMEVDCAYDGEEAVNLAKQVEYDIVLLDVMLPVYDGFEVLSRIREFSSMPVIMLTAKGDDMDKILGLEYGADDYITKPFSLAVLRARIEVQKRRIREQRENQSIKSILPNCYVIENLKFDFERLCFFKGEEELSLSRNEQKLLQIFLKNQGRILTREILMERLWQDGAEFVDENALSVTINRLRKKIEGGTKYIQTVYGQGYVWRKEE